MKRIIAGAMFATLCLLPAGQAAEFFNESDDYQDGEEIVNVFLKEDDYRLMVEDIERNGEGFDWGWVKTSQNAPSAPTEQDANRPKMLKWLPKRSGGRPAQPQELGFDLGSYRTVSVPNVENFAGLVPPGTLEAVHEAFTLAAKELGLEVVPGDKADLELKVAIVDLKRDSTYIYFANIDPFIELELRLRDLTTTEDLLLLRNQAHSNTPQDAAMNYASSLIKFLR